MVKPYWLLFYGSLILCFGLFLVFILRNGRTVSQNGQTVLAIVLW
jgi:hypothetical protein